MRWLDRASFDSMTRIERLAPLLEKLSDDEFEELVAAAAYAAGSSTFYDTLSATAKTEILAAIARLDSGEGIAFEDVKARLKAKLNSAGA